MTKHRGRIHACGHDAHIKTIILAKADEKSPHCYYIEISNWFF